MSAKAKSTKPVPKATAKQQKQDRNPSAEQLKSAYELWRKGGKSVWDLKRETKIRARVLLPAFRKLGTPAEVKLLQTPGAKSPKAAKSTKANKGKETSDASRAAA